MEAWQIIQGSLLVLIALIGAGIAYGQYRNAAVKLQLDLFDRRYKIFVAVKRLLQAVMQEANASLSVMAEFQYDVLEADYLFGPDVVAYVDILKEKGWSLHRARAAIADLHHPDRPDAINSSAELTLWFTRQFEPAKDVFRPYLRLDAHRLPTKRGQRMKAQSSP